MYQGNRLFFEMKELWKNQSEKPTQKKRNHEKMTSVKRTQGEDSINNFVEDVVNEVNNIVCCVRHIEKYNTYFDQ
jgi:sugar-specific transcriptional regulator TrmB